VGCEACKSTCPRGISQAKVMRAVRRVLTEFGGMPGTLQSVVASISSGGNPFMEGPEKRTEWTKGLDVPKFDGTQEYLYFSCCTPAYDARAKKLAVATVKILKAAGISFGIIGEEEKCCCEAIRRGGAEEVFANVAMANIAAFDAAGVKKILVQSPHCLITFKNEYPEFEGNYEVVHVTELFHSLLKDGKLKPHRPIEKKAVYHDPCTLGRQSGIYDEPRGVLKSIPGLELIEFPNFSREFSVCCGGGGGGLWVEQEMDARLSNLRVRQAVETGADILVVACPYCLQMFADAGANLGLELQISDVSELLAESLGL
jgi:Fe-S oxidoreductase